MKKLVIFTTLCLVAAAAFGQTRSPLAILPFTGGQGEEGETIAELFSFDARLNEVFNPIPRTSIARAISRERGFQMGSGMTDPNTVISIANEVGARYVVAGSITSVGRNNLLVIAIMDVKNLQQIAGDYQTYTAGRIEELRGKLPGMAANIIQATQKNTASLPKLAIVPVQLQGGADQRVADTLAQLLAIHLIRSGKYAVFPRTQSLDQVFEEHNAQMSGHTADKNIIGIGYGENPDSVLTVAARRLGNSNMFNAAIINLETRVQVVGRTVDYQDINDGMRAMETLAVYLTSTSEQVSKRQNEEAEAERKATERKRKEEQLDSFARDSGIGLGFRTGISFAFSEKFNSEYTAYYMNKNAVDLIHIPLAFTIGINFGSLFSIQSGFQYSFLDYGVLINPERIGMSFDRIQIPLLAKFNLSRETLIFSPFTGIGFNIPVLIDIGFHSSDDYEISLPMMSGIVGTNIGFKIGNTIFFMDIRYVGDFGETKWFFGLDDETSISSYSSSYTMSSIDISFGVEFIIPFKK
ncbi:hypothetical protein [Treponema sp. R80B11-R83G3]